MRRNRTRPLRLLTALGLVLGSGCVSALREPAALESIAAGGADVAQVRGLAAAAELWRQRTLDAVGQACAQYETYVTDETVQLEALLGASRARLWIADHHQDAQVRLESAVKAIDLAQWCARVAPQEVECDYLLALGLGLQVQERRSTALDGLPRIVTLLNSVIERAPLLDQAGPHRVMALVYLRAPGWPAGPGNADHGFAEATRAVELAPDHPPNRMALGEALRELDEPVRSRAEYVEAERLALEQVQAQIPDAPEWLELARAALLRAEQR